MDAGSTIVVSIPHTCDPIRLLTHRHQLPFRFLDLPAEVRLRIYEQLFGGTRAHIVWGWEAPMLAEAAQNTPCEISEMSSREYSHEHMFHFDHNNTSCHLESVILCTCRTVYNETLRQSSSLLVYAPDHFPTKCSSREAAFHYIAGSLTLPLSVICITLACRSPSIAGKGIDLVLTYTKSIIATLAPEV